MVIRALSVLARRRIEISVSAKSTAAPERIFPLLKNSETYPGWSMIDRYDAVKPGRDETNGIGAVRRLQTGSKVMCEEIVDIVPNRLVGYRLLSGLPLQDYQAQTRLDRQPDGGAEITWSCSFIPKYRGTGQFWKIVMRHILRRFVRDLARAGEQQPSC
jgi:hypothetical protein